VVKVLVDGKVVKVDATDPALIDQVDDAKPETQTKKNRS
jgi:hypothetical protein